MLKTNHLGLFLQRKSDLSIGRGELFIGKDEEPGPLDEGQRGWIVCGPHRLVDVGALQDGGPVASEKTPCWRGGSSVGRSGFARWPCGGLEEKRPRVAWGLQMKIGWGLQRGVAELGQKRVVELEQKRVAELEQKRTAE